MNPKNCPHCNEQVIYTSVVINPKDCYYIIICNNSNCLLMSIGDTEEECYDNWEKDEYYKAEEK